MIRLYVLDNGVIRMDQDDKVTMGASNAIPIHSFLIDTPDGYILFDTACDPEGMSGAWPKWLRENPYIAGEQGSVPERLAQLGVSPDDIRYVVMSHLHVDHAGCLKFFPRATTIVSREEYTKVMQDFVAGRLEGFHVESDVKSWLTAGIQWRLIDPETEACELVPGVQILHFGPGHSYGMLGLLVRVTSGQKYLLAADTIYTKGHMGPPVQIAGIAYDEEGYVRTVERIRALADEEGAQILFGHDMQQFQTLIKSTEGCYE